MIKKGFMMVIKTLVIVLIILFLAYMFKSCRSFGYRVFSDQAKDVPGSPAAVEAVIHFSPGESLLELGEDLENRLIIKDKWSFAVALRCMDDYNMIAEGDYTLKSTMKPSEILSTMLSTEEVQ